MQISVNPILSDSLRELIEEMKEKYEDPIVDEILKLDDYVREIRGHYYGQYLCEVLMDGLRALTTFEVSALSLRQENDTFEVSFLPKDKPLEYNGNNWSRKNRQTGKPGKIFQKLLVREFKQKEWEDFSNHFKACACCCNNFEIVEGKDIAKWYNQDNYYACKGTLGNSCMRYDFCGSYFKLYEDRAKMLITTKNGGLTGRAIVWEMEDGIVLLDRIYTCFDYLENCFIEYAKEHKWWIRDDNSLLHTGDDQYWYSPDDDYSQCTSREFKITLDKHYDYFPYVDSFRYYDENTNTISTRSDFEYTASLDSTDGEIYGRTEYVCEYCGHTELGYDDEAPDCMCWSEYDDCWYCEDCCWYSDGLDSYVSNGEARISVYDKYENTTDYPQSYVDSNLRTSPNDSGWIVLIGDKYYEYQESHITWNGTEFELQSSSD